AHDRRQCAVGDALQVVDPRPGPADTAEQLDMLGFIRVVVVAAIEAPGAFAGDGVVAGCPLAARALQAFADVAGGTLNLAAHADDVDVVRIRVIDGEMVEDVAEVGLRADL